MDFRSLVGHEPAGSKCAVGKLYRHTKSSSWSVVQDPVLHGKQVSELGQSYAIVHRYSMEQLEGEQSRHAWTTHSVVAQSKGLQMGLTQIFQGYPEWAPADNPFTFLPPYKPLIHRWEKINTFEAIDETTKKEMHILREELKPLIEVELHFLEEAKSTGAVSFDMLSLIFAPGDLLVTNIQGSTCICKLLSAPKLVGPTRKKRRRHFGLGMDDDDDDDDDVENDREKRYWHITFSQIDWDGSCCGPKITQKRIYEFGGMKAVKGLDVYPLSFSINQQERDLALARGRKFESLRGFHVKECIGAKIIEKEGIFGVEYVAEPVSGRVIVDAHAFYHCQEKVPPFIQQSIKSETSSEDSTGKLALEDDDDRHEDLRPLTDEECILAVSHVKGFDLRTKQWCYFNVDDLQDTTWNDSSYSNLVLPTEEKELLMGFTNKDRLREAGFDDFVKNKGKGIIILLYGPAGVGKTLTAEAVAEKSRVPLYVLSAGELGSKADKLERALQTALKCCQLWGAMLLLDEADVFLEARGSDNVERNELVSIFLRQLEYYQGLMFLTTNRVRKIDNAFLSRIDLILPYKDLDLNTRRELWAKFICRLPPSDVDLSENDIDDLATNKMNGREIKNVLKTALIIAAGAKPLRKHQLQTILDIRKRVDSLRLSTDGIAN
ncbi:P-loop containing nucleoside triphosphate hydrolase protein [Hypoxylon sp. FL1857]|nr:P-loop containing nucleoside triphosphate hydrolase protein [Hypoxylon sp. FL1857]